MENDIITLKGTQKDSRTVSFNTSLQKKPMATPAGKIMATVCFGEGGA
jgi:hypothetical protein